MNELFQLKKDKFRHAERRNHHEQIFISKRMICRTWEKFRDAVQLKKMIQGLEGNPTPQYNLLTIACFDFSFHWANKMVIDMGLDKSLLELLPKYQLECQQVFISLIRGEQLSIMYYYVEQNLILRLSNLLDSTNDKLEIFETISRFPECFINMTKPEDRPKILEQLKKHQDTDINLYYEIISNVCKEVEEFTEVKEAIKALSQGHAETLYYLIKFSELDKFDHKIVDYEFVNTVILSANKPFNHFYQTNIFILVQNLMIDSYEIRLIMYACGILEFIGKQLYKFSQNLKYSVVQEILCCISSICSQPDFLHKKNQELFKKSEIEQNLKSLLTSDYIDPETLHLGVLTMITIYLHYNFEIDYRFKTQLQDLAIKDQHVEQLIGLYQQQ